MRTAFIQTLCKQAKYNEHIWLLTGDLGYSVLESFADCFPSRYLNVGVAEQNMTGVAAGLALSGKIVVIYSIANFPSMRCLEQIRNDICYHNLNVKIVAAGTGLAYGSAGYTHYALEDLAIMRAMPNITVIAPGDPVETKLAVEAIVKHPGPCYLRLGKSGETIIHETEPDFKIGKAIKVKDGRDVTLFSTGSMLNETIKASKLLERQGISTRVISMHTIKPIDSQVIVDSTNTKLLVVIEEHSAIGGLYSAISEVLVQRTINNKPTIALNAGLNIPDKIGSHDRMKLNLGLNAENISKVTKGRLENLA